ncbi:hypothetical protein Bca4012_029541 [Brassica carinata]
MLPATSSTSSNSTHELLLFEALQEVLEEEIDRDPHPSTKSPTTVACFTTHPVGQFTIPVVIRGPGGVGRQLGAEHSQRLESYFQSIQMVACSTPYNAKGLMKAAIRSENPVILFEHVLLYNLKESIPDEEYICNLEEAEMVPCNAGAKTLVNNGYDPEVIDIRSLKPFDLYRIGNSVNEVPTPYAGTLEEWTVVQPAQIATAVEQLCQ